MKIAFSTLSCPDWSVEEIIISAKKYGYQGVEIRGIKKELDLLKVKEFLPENIKETRTLFEKNNIELICLSTSCSFSMENVDERIKQIEHTKKIIDLSRYLKVKIIRVFGGVFPIQLDENKVIDYIASALKEVGEYGKKQEVNVAIETHDNFTNSFLLLKTLNKIPSDLIKVIWDISLTYKEGKETIISTFKNIGDYIVHVHIKDAKNYKKNIKTVLLGEGDVPFQQALHLLIQKNYQGYLSVEWPKLWNESLLPAEKVLPFHIKKLKEYLKDN